MPTTTSLVADSERFRDMATSEQVLDFIEERFRSFGATRFLATGIPLPGRLLEPLMLRMAWPDPRGERPFIEPTDSLLQFALRARRAFFGLSTADPAFKDSALTAAAGPGQRLAGVPICAFLPYQATVIAAGADLNLELRAALAIDYFVVEGFRRLFTLGELHRDRPGDLSARERRVLELSATGKTANEIASVLQISQRTVHAHLQNASEKLKASNKTQTVVEALLYGQIKV